MSQHYEPGPEETLTDILSDDDAVDEMPPIRIKDAYVRMRLFEIVHDQYLKSRHGTDSMANSEYEKLMHYLEDRGKGGFSMTLVEFSGKALSPNFCGRLLDRPSEGMIREAFDTITNENMTDEERVKAARETVKETLRTAGMPKSKIARAAVQDWKATRPASN